MLSTTLITQLTDHLKNLKQPIQLSAWFDTGESSAAMKELLGEISGASSLVRLVLEPNESTGERTPSFGIHLPGEAASIRFAGSPLGHEFTSLVLGLLHVSGHPPRISDELKAKVMALVGPMRFETFYSTSCQNCPDVVQALNIISALNPNVEHVAINGADHEPEVTRRKILAVPTVFLNGEVFGHGRMTLEEILDKLSDESAGQRAKALHNQEPFDLLVVGGGPAGAAAAIYAARKGIRTGLVAERFGGQVADTMSIENYISVPRTEGPLLVAAMEAHVGSYPVQVMKNQRAKRIISGEIFSIELESGATLKSRSVVIATGARWRNMGVPGEGEYRNRGVTYCPHCDGPLFKGKRVAVIGGGNSGVEAAIDLAGIVEHVTVLEFADSLKADAVLVRKLHSLPNIEVRVSARTTAVQGDGDRVVGLIYEDRVSGEIRALKVAGIFVQIGLLPNTEWLKQSLDLNAAGEIEVDAKGATSLPGVFAAGDVTTVPFKQIVIAAGDGAKASLAAFQHLIRSPIGSPRP